MHRDIAVRELPRELAAQTARLGTSLRDLIGVCEHVTTLLLREKARCEAQEAGQVDLDGSSSSNVVPFERSRLDVHAHRVPPARPERNLPHAHDDVESNNEAV